jgi:enoyl-CoA hydratase/carnithine racemase
MEMPTLSYKSIKVEFHKPLRMIKILLDRPQSHNALTSEMLFEIDALFNWLGSHVEIDTIILSSTQNDFFSSGMSTVDCGREDFESFLYAFQKLQLTLCQLPQVIICDLQKGAQAEGVEISLPADIRIMHEEGGLQLAQLQRGYTPFGGSSTWLQHITRGHRGKSWLLEGIEIYGSELVSFGLVHHLYNDQNHHDVLMDKITQIHQLPSVQRIQMKLAHLKGQVESIVQYLKFEKECCLAGLETDDWKEARDAGQEKRRPVFYDAKDLQFIKSR